MIWLPFTVAIVGWLVGSIVVLTIRGVYLSRRFAILVLLCSTLGAGIVQYVLLMGVRRTERLSGAHLVGVTSLQLQEDAALIRRYLYSSAGKTEDEQGSGANLDWSGSFKEKAADVSATLAAVEKNVYIRDNYSVWMGDIEFRRKQLDRVAKRITTLQAGTPRQTNLTLYQRCVDLTVNVLDDLAHEMRSRRPGAYCDDRPKSDRPP